MNAVELIIKKRRGERLSREEISFLIEGYCREVIPDYQMAAWCMAVFFRGMDDEEATALTEVMAASGEMADLSEIPGPKVDKHSTGGVGDKTSLIVGPLVASVGVPVCKMSGRGLGHTGGTIDKLESIPGLTTTMTRERLMAQVRQIGIGIAGQTKGMVPADKKLYALRDVTGTVESTPLIAASIMSKKLAGGANGIVLDVKVGNGAFLKTREEAMVLGRLMVQIGHGAGRRTEALLTAMDQPLGNTVGNALEVREAIMSLRGEGPEDLDTVSLALSGRMLYLAGRVGTPQEGETLLRKQIQNGDGLRKFTMMIENQGGDPRVVEDLTLLPQAPVRLEVMAQRGGYLTQIDTEMIGRIAMNLGAGRRVKDDLIDPAVGIVLRKKLGDKVEAGESLAEIHCRTKEAAKEAAHAYQGAIGIGEERRAFPIILGEISIDV